ncbi:MAG: YesL family protein [Massiliimalia sp.]|jgi:uncharacterized membrane protein YesL
MAGFFGFFDYSKPGKGVDKDAPQKKRFFYFFELYFRKFWKLITLNLMYVLFCIPIITIGPATAAMSKILRDFSMERSVFLWSDFVEAFKKNFKQGLAMEIIDILVFFVAITSCVFYSRWAGQNKVMYVPFVIVGAILIVAVMMNYFIFVMIPTLDMKLKAMIRNAFLLSILALKTNVCTLIFTLLFSFAVFFYLPAAIILVPTIYFSTLGFIIVFNSYQYLEKYIIQPYYEQTGERRPDVYYPDEDEFDEDDVIFEDIGTREQPVQTATVKKGKTIK